MVRFVVMASGRATRMGQDKLALPWRDSSVLGYVLNVIFESITGQSQSQSPSSKVKSEAADVASKTQTEVWVVARKPMEAYHFPDPALDRQKEKSLLQLFENYGGVWLTEPEPRPLSETLRLGLADLPEWIQGICFVPGDQVGLEPQKLAEMTQCFLESQPDFLVPKVESAEGEEMNAPSGSPVFFHKRYLEELRSLQGEQGGRAILNRHPGCWLTYPVPAEFMEDVDTPQDYQRLHSEVQRKKHEETEKE